MLKHTGSAERLTNEQLLDRADRLLEAAPENMDVEAFEACLAELQERTPVMVEYDPDRMKKRVQKAFPQLGSGKRSPGKRGRTAWRTVLIAAVLTVLLAAGSMAGGIFGDWSVYFHEDNSGTRRVVAETTYGGGVLPVKSVKEIQWRAAQDAIYHEGQPRAQFYFDTLSELEAFMGTDLVKCDQMTAANPSCAGTYLTWQEIIDHIGYRHVEYSISGTYTLSDGEHELWCSFSFTTQKDTPVSNWFSAEGENIHFYAYELKQLGVTASIAAGMGDGERCDVYFVKDNIAYRITSTTDESTLLALLDTLE